MVTAVHHEPLVPPPSEKPNNGLAYRLGVLWRIYRTLGPGLITGASDDDPSGIATYSQVGAQFGYGLLWTTIFSFPLMTAIQEISARVGRVTGSGIAGNLRRHYPIWLLRGVLGLIVVANVFNLGADIAAMGAAAQLILPWKIWVFIALFGLLSAYLQVQIPYERYVKYLKWLTLSLFAYIAASFFIEISWTTVLRSTFVPTLMWSKTYFTALVAVLGTTISPYLFIWQASQEVEELHKNRAERALKDAPSQARAQLGRIRTDTYFGMAISNVVAFFIILMAAVSLHAKGIGNIGTAAEAAQALRPLGGRWATGLFACGIIGTGLLAIPVLAGSVGYAIGEAFRWPASLAKRADQAPGFYATVVASTVAGIALNFWHIDPIRALYWAAVLNGILAGPLMAVIMHMASSPKVMGKFTLPRYLRIAGWAATAVMFAAVVGGLATSG